MNKKHNLLSLLFMMIMVVSCSNNVANSTNNNDSQSSTNIASNNSLPINNGDDYTTPIDNSFSYESLATSDYRDFLSLTYGDWKFHKGELKDGEKVTKYDSSWSDVTLPHTWNKTDGQDGGGNYLRCESWYHHKVTLGKDFLSDKSQFLEFLGVNMQAKVYINNKLVGSHKGGYTGFRFDVTEYLMVGENLIAVWVSNVKTQDIAPLGADFNFYGGIYREVNLFSLPNVHVDMLDYGSSGLKLTTTDVSEESAKLKIEATLVNDINKTENVDIEAIVKVPDKFEEISQIPEPDFDISALTTGEIIETINEKANIEDTYKFEKEIIINNPKLWNGRKFPFRYQVILNVRKDGKIIDQVTSYVGFRTFEVTKEGGSFLNGEAYPLRGVSRHQEWKNMGNSISKQHHEVDFGYMYEMGLNSIRLAHYPQSNYMYDLCDRYGIVVWAEIPFVNHVGTATNFLDVTKLQLTELIRQQYNRASIVVWGLQNEVEASYNASMVKIMYVLNNLAHEEDPTRLTTQATNSVTAKYWSSDLLAWNTYPGWYSGTTIAANMDTYYTDYSMPVGISEYGYGANIYQHADYPTRGNHDVFPEGQWHPQEYQNQQHELAIYQVTDPKRNNVWCAYIWNMFDFASDSRYEGGQPGMNDKGLISYDRTIKKDTFYLYKANWNKTDKFVHLTSKGYVNRAAADTYVKAYSNFDKLALYINDDLVSILENNGYGIFNWDVKLPTGNIKIEVKVLDEGYETVSDSAEWRRNASNRTTIKSETLAIDNTNKIVFYSNGMVISDLIAELDSDYNCTYKVYDKNGKQVESGLVTEDMKLRVYPENGGVHDVYSLKKAHLSTNKNITVSSNEGTNLGMHAVDGNLTTRWAAANGTYPQELVIDLGGTFFLEEINISWYVSGTRSYKYKIYIAGEDKVYSLAIDRSSNNISGEVEDDLNGLKGRYIKIEVTGVSDGSGYASIVELVVEGWGINTAEYEVDEVNNQIKIPTPQDNLTKDEFLKKLKCEGDYELSFSHNENYIKNGDIITIVDSTGKAHEYTIVFK